MRHARGSVLTRECPSFSLNYYQGASLLLDTWGSGGHVLIQQKSKSMILERAGHREWQTGLEHKSMFFPSLPPSLLSVLGLLTLSSGSSTVVIISLLYMSGGPQRMQRAGWGRKQPGAWLPYLGRADIRIGNNWMPLWTQLWKTLELKMQKAPTGARREPVENLMMDSFTTRRHTQISAQ